jgi:hypothetical protein
MRTVNWKQLQTNLDADEVRLALPCDCLGQQGFATSRRAIEEDAARWLHAELEEHLRVLDWVLESEGQSRMGQKDQGQRPGASLT